MKKAVLKRIKITKSGKLLRRGSGQNHFNAKASRTVQMRQGKLRPMTMVLGKKIKAYINS
jgi:ribosomal protein L35